MCKNLLDQEIRNKLRDVYLKQLDRDLYTHLWNEIAGKLWESPHWAVNLDIVGEALDRIENSTSPNTPKHISSKFPC